MNPSTLPLLSLLVACTVMPWVLLRTVKCGWRAPVVPVGDMLASTLVVGFAICVFVGMF